MTDKAYMRKVYSKMMVNARKFGCGDFNSRVFAKSRISDPKWMLPEDWLRHGRIVIQNVAYERAAQSAVKGVRCTAQHDMIDISLPREARRGFHTYACCHCGYQNEVDSSD